MTQAFTEPTPSIRSASPRPLLAGLVILAAAVLPMAGKAHAQQEQVRQWSDSVWQAAADGDAQLLQQRLSELPTNTTGTAFSRLAESIELRNQHIDQTNAKRLEAQSEALEQMHEQIAEGKLTEALTSAVKYQTLSDDFINAIRNEQVARLLDEAEQQSSEAIESGDWLLAQELLYRLRTLHDDPDLNDEFEQYQSDLERVNRRIGLLAEYAPRRLHDLRSIRADRLAPDEEFPEFNQAFASEWKEQVDGITQPMVWAALRTAANEHIQSGCWKPLLQGGLSAVELLVTTSDLSETFESLQDAEKVALWTETIDQLEAAIEAVPPQALSRRDYRRIIGTLLMLNRDTIALDDAVLLREFGDGAMYELAQQYEDQYSEIIWPDRLRRFRQQVDGEFVGVGILIRHDEKREIQIVNPLEGSPASRSGIKPNDRIAAVDGVSTVGWSLNKAVDSITGPSGEPVILTVKREGVEEPMDVPIIRDTIKMRSVNGWWKKGLNARGEPEWDWYMDPDAGIGYVRLTSFNEDSYDDFLASVSQMRMERQLNGLVLDLRHNPGGLLKAAHEFSNLFIPKGEIVAGQDRNGNIVWTLDAERSRAMLADIPTVILINQGSASASEIVAGAVKAHEGAVVLGERSFGKGSVQTVHDISDRNGDAAVKLTTQYYVLPGGRLVHKTPGDDDWGVLPNLVVSMTPDQIEKSLELRQNADIVDEYEVAEGESSTRPDVKELTSGGLDPQLEMALLLLRAKTLPNSETLEFAAEG
ncbi:MAG: hypothetical protein CMJ32_12140 [Phycisphaerae bacterium]|nr:hypothetical protein [Phycisphaerae bacterium]